MALWRLEISGAKAGFRAAGPRSPHGTESRRGLRVPPEGLFLMFPDVPPSRGARSGDVLLRRSVQMVAPRVRLRTELLPPRAGTGHGSFDVDAAVPAYVAEAACVVGISEPRWARCQGPEKPAWQAAGPEIAAQGTRSRPGHLGPPPCSLLFPAPCPAMALLTYLALTLLPLLFFTHTFLLLLLRQRLSPLRLLPAPPSPSWLTGNLAELHDQENNGVLARWAAAHGPSFCYRGFLGGCRLLTADPRALAHVLARADAYPKPDFVRDSLASMAAGHEGLLTVEGADHRRQRRIVAPAFGRAQVRSLAPLFAGKARELAGRWGALADAVPAPPRVDVLAWLSRATLDVIGLAGALCPSSLPDAADLFPGFGYEFNALTPRAPGESGDELAEAFATIFSTARKFRIMTILQVWFPILRRFVSPCPPHRTADANTEQRRNNATMAAAQATMHRIGTQLIDARRAQVEAELRASKAGADGIDGDTTVLGRDLLSVLIRSNLTTAPAARLSPRETLCQISTFIAAGFETTSSALSWALLALANSPHTQDKLRTALRSLPPPPEEGAGEGKWGAWADALDGCAYLECVVRESLRLHAPITNTMRVCAVDHDVIPTSAPWVGRDGVTRTGIEVRRGDIVSVPVQAVNRAAGWGDAGVFRPERWAGSGSGVGVEGGEKDDGGEKGEGVPGAWAGTLTFLAGPRACIGQRFALLEMKVFLAVLLRDLAVGVDPGLVVEKKINVVTRPFVASEPELGNQLPLRISRVPPAPAVL
ncbi:hypothetical protein HWV62_11347 [Athelia sp. TMB]|nr:hypothetical protein HWV62_11347 [Athelia sp. TMB]